MKRGTENLPKFYALQEALSLPRYAAIGLLQTLWSITAESTPRGDVGSFTNAQISKRLEWEGDCDALIGALVRTGWLDESDSCRLYVHDWHEHAEDMIQMRLARRTQLFAVGDMPRLTKFSVAEKQAISEAYDCAHNGARKAHK